VCRCAVTALFGRPTTGCPVALYVSFRVVSAAVSGALETVRRRHGDVWVMRPPEANEGSSQR
jgi:hypothetical protein